MSNFPPQYAQQPGAPPPPPKKSNAKMFLFIGLGCLGLIVIGVVAVVLLAGGIIYGIANSPAATAAKAFVEQSAAAKQELGEPLSTTFVMGNVDTNTSSGTAMIIVSVTGPKGTGAAQVDLKSSGGESWEVTSAKLEGGPSKKTITLK